jgi:hypothetical protein
VPPSPGHIGHVGTSETIGAGELDGLGHDTSAQANVYEKPNVAMLSKSGITFIFGANLDLIKSHVNLPPLPKSALNRS